MNSGWLFLYYNNVIRIVYSFIYWNFQRCAVARWYPSFNTKGPSRIYSLKIFVTGRMDLLNPSLSFRFCFFFLLLFLLGIFIEILLKLVLGRYSHHDNGIRFAFVVSCQLADVLRVDTLCHCRRCCRRRCRLSSSSCRRRYTSILKIPLFEFEMIILFALISILLEEI